MEVGRGRDGAVGSRAGGWSRRGRCRGGAEGCSCAGSGFGVGGADCRGRSGHSWRIEEVVVRVRVRCSVNVDEGALREG